MLLVDTHAHLNDKRLYPIRKEVVQRAESRGVKYIFVVGYDISSSRLAVEIAHEFENVFAIVGIHPNSIDEINRVGEIEELLSDEKTIAVGEIGLDYHWMTFPKDQQMEGFRIQINLARKHNLPIVLHVRDAYPDTIGIIEEENPEVPVIFHSFSDKPETARWIVERDYFLSFNGMLTYKNPHLHRSLKGIGLKNVLSETDSPYLTPAPHRGKMNEPMYVVEVVEKMARLLNKSVEEVAERLVENAERAFGINLTR